MKTTLLSFLLSACGAVSAAEGTPGRPSDCCWLIGQTAIEKCMRDFLDEPGTCAHTTCATTGYVEVSWPTDAGETACADGGL